MNDASLLRTEILDGTVWALLRGVVSRRVPAADVDDVVQATLCDALDARRIPEERDEMRRWLVGIAKNKATDHFRRMCREVATDLDACSGPVPSTDAMVLLKSALAEVEQHPSMRDALDLALREADGESYAELAHGRASTEVALRQRVSRFRRNMAARWLVAAAFVTILAIGGATWMHRREAGAILPDVDVATRIALHPMEGHWVLTSWTGSEVHVPRTGGVEIDVRAGTVRLVAAGVDHLFAASNIETMAEGTERWHLASPSAGSVTVLVKRAGTTATVTVEQPRWSGTATLVRR